MKGKVKLRRGELLVSVKPCPGMPVIQAPSTFIPVEEIKPKRKIRKWQRIEL